MNIKEIFARLRYWSSVDRIGPDIPLTHWRLHFKSAMVSLCCKKFKYFGEGAEISSGAYAINCANISLGKCVVIRLHTMLFADSLADGGARITIEDDVLLGSRAHIIVGNHRFDEVTSPIIDQRYSAPKPVHIKKDSLIGTNVTILSRVTMGNNTVIGAGSVVAWDMPDQVLAVGTPTKVKNFLGALEK